MAITFGTYGSLPTITLENEQVKAVILPTKGAELLEFVHLKTNTNILYRTELPIEAYDDLDLSKQRLSFHSEKLLGGYMNLLPHRGLYKEQVLEQHEGGISATLPWEYDILEDTPIQIKIKFHVRLPIFPLYLERIYTLKTDESFLNIDDHVKNIGEEEVKFTWTQHALFGSGILDENAKIELPSQMAFKAWEHAEQPSKSIETFIQNSKHIELKQGTFDLSRPLATGYPDYEFVVFKDLKKGKFEIKSPVLGSNFFFRWDLKQFPYLRAVYKHDGHGPLVGLEPSDDLFSGWEHSYKYKTYTTLQSQASIVTDFQFGFIEK